MRTIESSCRKSVGGDWLGKDHSLFAIARAHAILHSSHQGGLAVRRGCGRVHICDLSIYGTCYAVLLSRVSWDPLADSLPKSPHFAQSLGD
jgi:hypothetical protein